MLDYRCGVLLIMTVLALIGYLPAIAAAFSLLIEHLRGGQASAALDVNDRGAIECVEPLDDQSQAVAFDQPHPGHADRVRPHR